MCGRIEVSDRRDERRETTEQHKMGKGERRRGEEQSRRALEH